LRLVSTREANAKALSSINHRSGFVMFTPGHTKWDPASTMFRPAQKF
jgi:hypothetical protein